MSFFVSVLCCPIAFLFRTAEVFPSFPIGNSPPRASLLISCFPCRPHCCVDLLRRSFPLHPFFSTAVYFLVSFEITDEVSLLFVAVPFVPAAPGSFTTRSSFPACQLCSRRTNVASACQKAHKGNNDLCTCITNRHSQLPFPLNFCLKTPSPPASSDHARDPLELPLTSTSPLHRADQYTKPHHVAPVTLQSQWPRRAGPGPCSVVVVKMRHGCHAAFVD